MEECRQGGGGGATAASPLAPALVLLLCCSAWLPPVPGHTATLLVKVTMTYNRGPITHLEYKTSFGQLEVFREKSLLIWIIGQKFPKSMEISLSGTVTFGAKSHEKQPFDPICIGETAYLK